MARSKDNVDLICDIAERAGLFEKSNSLEDVLQTVVGIVAWHMKAAVCSIYLLDDKNQELVLRATQGLSPSAVGTVRLNIGEGIVGRALKELRPIYVGRGSKSPHFKVIKGINEEAYEAILAVPILRGLTRIGTLVVQDTQPDYFDENDAKALRAIAAQLAPAIDNAGLLLHLRQEQGDAPNEEEKGLRPQFLRGSTAAQGVARGTMVLVENSFDEMFQRYQDHPDVSEEHFRRALQSTEQQIESVQREMEKYHADIASLIFSAHLLILKDPSFSEEMITRVREGSKAHEAVASVLNHYMNLFSGSTNPRLREKIHDLKDLGHRLLQNIYPDEQKPADYSGEIVVAGELLPSDIVKLAAQRAEGIILTGAGAASHVAILAASLKIPMVVLDRSQVKYLKAGMPVIVDAMVGHVYLDPEPGVIEHYQAYLEPKKEEQEGLEVTRTRDGKTVKLMANINLLSDLERAKQVKAEGVGLYRSEFPFIIRNDFPSEEEQFHIYRHLAESMQGREIVFRTLDIGGDKMLSYFPQPKEDNPFLGLRAIRFSLRHRDIFSQQLRAILRAGECARLRIMFPLVASVDDFMDAREVVKECLENLAQEQVAHCSNPELGVMIELPSAVEVAVELAREADFLCIGSNDLTQYMLAVDRTNAEVSHLYREHHPAVLRAMKRVAFAAISEGADLSLCGEVLRDEKMIPFILGIGIHKLSANPEHLPRLQRMVNHIDMNQAVETAAEMLTLGRISEVEAYLKNMKG